MKKIALIALLTSAALMASPASYNACKGCHGAKGEKNSMVPASKPNTLTKAEIVTALHAYKAGTRNKYGKGAMMKNFTRSLDDAKIQEIANFIGK